MFQLKRLICGPVNASFSASRFTGTFSILPRLSSFSLTYVVEVAGWIMLDRDLDCEEVADCCRFFVVLPTVLSTRTNWRPLHPHSSTGEVRLHRFHALSLLLRFVLNHNDKAVKFRIKLGARKCNGPYVFCVFVFGPSPINVCH